MQLNDKEEEKKQVYHYDYDMRYDLISTGPEFLSNNSTYQPTNLATNTNET